MKDEIAAAVTFLIRLINKNGYLPREKLESLREKLHVILTERFRNHWFPEKPYRGQAYRCIRVNETERRDPILEQAANECGLNYEDLRLPVELTLWVDPEEVCCRFGEHRGSYGIVASFKGGNKENYADQINLEELEIKSMERAKQASFDIMNGKKRHSPHSNRNKNGYSHHLSNSSSQLNSLQISQVYAGFSCSPPSQYFSYSSSPPHQPLYHQHGSPPHHSNSNFIRFSQKPLRGNHQNGFSSSVFGSNANNPQSSYSHKTDRYHWVNKSLVKA